MTEEGQNQGDFIPDAVDAVQMEIDQLQADPSYLDPSHPMHKVTVQKVTQLFQQKYPEEGQAGPEQPPGSPQPPQKEAVSPIPGIELPELPTGEWDLDAIKGFIPIAREMGLNNEEIGLELQAFAAGGSRFDPVSFSEDEGIDALNERWGKGAANIVRQAQEYINSLPAGTKEKLVSWLETTGFGNHPKIIEALARRGTRGAKYE